MALCRTKAGQACPSTGPINPKLAGNTLPATLCYVAHGDIFNVKNSFNPLPGKAVTERSNFETYELFIYGDLYLITNSFCKNVLRKATP